MFGRDKNPQNPKATKRGGNAFVPSPYNPADYTGLSLLKKQLDSVSQQQAGLLGNAPEIRGAATDLNESHQAAIAAAEQAANAANEAERKLNDANTAVETAKNNVRDASSAANEARRTLERKKDDLSTAQQYFPGVQEEFNRAQSAKTEADSKLQEKTTAKNNANSAVITASAEQSARQSVYDTFKGMVDGEADETTKNVMLGKLQEADAALNLANNKLSDAKTALNTAESELNLANSEAERANTSFESAKQHLDQANSRVSTAESELKTAEFALTNIEGELKTAERNQSDAEKAAVHAAIELEIAQIRAKGAAEKRDVLEQLAGTAAYEAEIADYLLGVFKVTRDDASDVEQNIIGVESSYHDMKTAYEQEVAAREAREGTINDMRNDRYQNDYLVDYASQSSGYAALPDPGANNYGQAQLPARTTDILTVPVITMKGGKIVQK